MKYRLLPWILDKERGNIKLLENRWRPTSLLYVSQARVILQDVAQKYRFIANAMDEVETLDRAAKYVQLISRMRVFVRQAHFTWKGDQLVFIRAVSGFYTAYAAILRLIKEDEARGILKTD